MISLCLIFLSIPNFVNIIKLFSKASLATLKVDEKLAQARVLYLYQMAHPGKKLNFMGWEVAQLREWDERREQDWFLRDYPAHDAFFRFACELGAAYRDEPALWELDYEENGFEWLEANNEECVTYAFLRKGASGRDVLCALNLSDKTVETTLKLEDATSATLLIDTDWERYGGSTPDATDTELECEDGLLTLELPACSGQLFVLV